MTIIVPISGDGVTLADLLASIRAKGYDADTTRGAQIAALNDAYRRVSAMHRWPWTVDIALYVMTPNQAWVEPSDAIDFARIDTVRLEIATEYYDLKYVDWNNLRAMTHVDRQAATPQYWSWANGTFFFYPAPDRAYTMTVDFNHLVSRLVVDADTVDFPSEYIDVLVWAACTDLAFRERDWSQFQAAQASYQGRLAEMIAETGVKSKQSNREVGDSGFYDRYASDTPWLI